LIFIRNPQVIMYIKDVVDSRPLNEAAGFVYLWHMPLLFAVSGAATFFALGFRTAGRYLRERVLRLLFPLAFGIATYIPITTFIRFIGRPNAPTFADHYAGFFRIDPADLTGYHGGFTPAHLWFILFLFVFSLVGLPVFLALRSERGKRWTAVLAGSAEAPWTLLLWVIPLALAASLDLLGDKNPLYYFLVFVFGYLLASDPRFQRAVDRLTWVALAYGLIEAYIRVAFPQWRYTEWSPRWVLLGLMLELGRWSLTLAVLGLGHRFLNRTSGSLRYANEAAMPFYLLHMTFTTLTGFFVIRLDAPVAAKYPLIVLGATALTLAFYEVFVRRWNPVRLLFGMKALPLEGRSIEKDHRTEAAALFVDAAKPGQDRSPSAALRRQEK
jgi:hypothetical protein